MSTTASASRQQLLTSLRSWRGTLTEADRALFKSFVDAALGRLRGSFLSDHGPKDILAAFEQVFQFARERPTGQVLIDIASSDRGTVLMTAMEDRAFIVDTQRMFLKSHGAEWAGGFNLVLPLQRDPSGRLIGVGDAGEPESIGYVRAEGGDLLVQRESAITELQRNLGLAARIVGDFDQMKALIEELVQFCRAERADEETAAFLEWLLAENFVFMGAESMGAESMGAE
nr:NAD-glutamate dehydrogenase [Deltaproteobacteria bacterium]